MNSPRDNVCVNQSVNFMNGTCVISDPSGIIQLQQTSRIDFDVDLGWLDRKMTVDATSLT